MTRDKDNEGRELKLDASDRALLDAIQNDCKQSLAELGQQVGLSAPSVLERMRKLEEAGLVRGYHAHLDGRRLGLDIGAFIGVGIDHPKRIAAFEKELAQIGDVLECHHVTGRHTLMLKVRTENTESLHRLIQQLRELPGVARTETMIVLATQMERTTLPIPASDDRPAKRRRS
ncbi:MAG: Lrp/AsnC family transcriptional regulator [Deltaproteobacteria bacterium]|jgi:Lrp/AsnC family leucine-responsive transcriptional regulator